MNSVLFAFLQLGLIYFVYWRGFKRGMTVVLHTAVRNLQKQGMGLVEAMEYVDKITDPVERRDNV
jgi:hypothetical protein